MTNPHDYLTFLTEPEPDNEQNLFYSALNALRCAGQEKIADDLEERMEKLLEPIQ